LEISSSAVIGAIVAPAELEKTFIDMSKAQFSVLPYSEKKNRVWLCRSTAGGILRECVTTVDYTECPKRNVPDFGRVFLMLKYTDITQNTYVQS
jgi:hypothetical protein